MDGGGTLYTEREIQLHFMKGEEKQYRRGNNSRKEIILGLTDNILSTT